MMDKRIKAINLNKINYIYVNKHKLRMTNSSKLMKI